MFRENLAGINFSIENCDEIIRKLKDNFENGKKSRIFTPNIEFISKSIKSNSFAMEINKSEFVIPDGIAVVALSRMRGGRIKQRIPGIDFSECIFSEFNFQLKIYLLGSTDDVCLLAKEYLEKKYNIKIVGYRNGYYSEVEEDGIVNEINSTNANMLIVCLGAPKQEYFINKHFDGLNSLIFLGLGGALDVWSGKKRRAPRIFRKLGLEWFYRVLVEPRRLLRIMNCYNIIKYLFGYKNCNKALLSDIDVNICKDIEDAVSRLVVDGGFKYNWALALNPEKIVKIKSDVEFRKIIQNSDFIYPDGVGVVVPLFFKGYWNIKRIPGCELWIMVINKMKKYNKKIYIYGSTISVVESVVKDLIKAGANVVGYSDGYSKDPQEVIKSIALNSPDLVIVALGSPKQEYFIYDAQEVYSNCLYMGVGGSLDVYSGAIKRAPIIVRKVGLEWLFRLIQQPWRIKRYKYIYKYLKIIFKL